MGLKNSIAKQIIIFCNGRTIQENIKIQFSYSDKSFKRSRFPGRQNDELVYMYTLYVYVYGIIFVDQILDSTC